MNTHYQAERFIEILEKAGGEDFFNNKDGVLSTTVHTGKTIEAFEMKIGFPRYSVLITTSPYLAVEEHNYEQIKILLESINDLGINGFFYINEDNTISFSTICEFDDLINADNPFDIVFSGCESFEKYTNVILKALSGVNVFYKKV